MVVIFLLHYLDDNIFIFDYFFIASFTTLSSLFSTILLFKKKELFSIHSNDERSHHLIKFENISYKREMFRGGEIPNGAYHREDLLARTTSYKSIKISRERCIQGILVSCLWNRDAFIKRYFFLKSFKIYLYEINFETL